MPPPSPPLEDEDSASLDLSDLTPIEQDDGPVPVVKIDYTPKFSQVMGYFRRVLVDGEHSTRALSIAAEVIEHNAANYTAWQFRRKCIRELTKDKSLEEQRSAWQKELAYCTEQCLENMKNYQVWFHRRACVAALHDPSGELDFMARVLSEDAKNYHAWGHRQWVLKHFSLWEGELEYIDALLEADVRNNSAWNQRHYVLRHSADVTDAAVVAREVDRALAIIARAPTNGSPWGFIKGLVEPIGYARFPQVRAACERLGRGEGVEPPSPCHEALALLVDILLEPGSDRDVDRARGICEQLSITDKLRERYWRWREARCSAPPPDATTEVAELS